MGVGLAPGSGAEERGVTSRIQLGSREPIAPEGLHISTHCQAATDFSNKADKCFSILAELTSQQPVFAQNSPCLFTRVISLLMDSLHKGDS